MSDPAGGGRPFVCLALAVLAFASPQWSRAADPPARSAASGGPTQYPDRLLVEAGRRIYREGRGATGEALKAIVQGDVQVDGTQVTCESCHRRSGMGTGEGGRLSPPVAGSLLFAPGRHRGRPAYTDASLARAQRDGIDPAGRPLDPLMPRYDLGEKDLAAVTAYLRALGADSSPGASETSLRFATVIATDAPADQREAVTGILTAFFAEKNAQVRREADRTAMRRAPGEPLVPYRRWELEIWEVSGPAGRWRAQIEARYQERPVFAILSGLVIGPWQPIHDFCEAHGIPCLLPNTDLAPAAEGDYYGLYFSGGMRLEAEILASEISATGKAADVVQIVAEADPTATTAAAAFEAAIGRRGGRVRSEGVGAASGVGATAQTRLIGPASAVVLWAPAGVIGAPEAAGSPGSPVYFSSTILGDTGETLPVDLRSRARVVHRGRLPGDRDTALERFRLWARARGIAARAERVQSQTWFACMTLMDGANHLGLFPYRDYLLDLLDHSPGLSAFLPGFPRGEMGPGQRFLAKGGYVIPAGGGEPVWIVP